MTHSDGQDRLTVTDNSILENPPSAGAAQVVTSLRHNAPAMARRFRGLLALDDFERYGQRLLPPMIHLYVAGAVETGASLQRAKAAYEGLALLPRMLRDVSGRSQETELFGKIYASPFGIAPLGGAAFVAYRGDLVLAEAARQANIPMILSASSLITLEDVHAQNQDSWFQAYLAGDQGRIDRLVDRVAASGYRTLVVTADTPMLGNREHNIRSGFSMPIRITPKVAWQSAATHPRWLLGTVGRTLLRHGAPHFKNMEVERGPPMMSRQAVRNTTARDKLSWVHLADIRRRWKGRLLVKGLLAPADVQLARECGVDGVVLSNHGGRQLDHTVAPLAVLPEIAAAKGEMKIIIDSGIRRGTDVIKALALGADFVLLGRPFLYAAVLGGSDGVLHAIRLLQDEIDRDMALVGVRRLNEVGPELVRRADGGMGA